MKERQSVNLKESVKNANQGKKQGIVIRVVINYQSSLALLRAKIDLSSHRRTHEPRCEKTGLRGF